MAKRRITVDLDERLLTALDAAAAEGNRSRN
jgi:metal-responsive CopG/Arc/MetJ family transcriptional regulator